MRNRFRMMVFCCAAVFACAPAYAIDVWDQATEDDNSAGTDNGLVHGTDQLHDLGSEGGVADQDWSTITSAAYSSYEIVIDGTTGDLNLSTNDVTRVASDGTTVLQDSIGLSGFSRVLRWSNNTDTALTQYIRVTGASCGTTCSSNDQYRIRAYETTYAIPRFNNSGSQVTVLIVSNMAAFACSAAFHFYNAAGTLLGSATNSYSMRQTYVLNTSTLAFASGQSGSIFVTHNCGYGGLAGKAVALEPATGFSFDTPIVPRIL